MHICLCLWAFDLYFTRESRKLWRICYYPFLRHQSVYSGPRKSDLSCQLSNMNQYKVNICNASGDWLVIDCAIVCLDLDKDAGHQLPLAQSVESRTLWLKCCRFKSRNRKLIIWKNVLFLFMAVVFQARHKTVALIHCLTAHWIVGKGGGGDSPNCRTVQIVVGWMHNKFIIISSNMTYIIFTSKLIF